MSPPCSSHHGLRCTSIWNRDLVSNNSKGFCEPIKFKGGSWEVHEIKGASGNPSNLKRAPRNTKKVWHWWWRTHSVRFLTRSLYEQWWHKMQLLYSWTQVWFMTSSPALRILYWKRPPPAQLLRIVHFRSPPERRQTPPRRHAPLLALRTAILKLLASSNSIWSRSKARSVLIKTIFFGNGHQIDIFFSSCRPSHLFIHSYNISSLSLHICHRCRKS